MRLAGVSGAVRWRVELNGMRASVFDYAYDEARRVAVDPHGDVIAAGSMEQPSTEWDLAVVKLDGTTGAERWRALVSGTAEGSRDVATDVTTDAAGDVVVVGYLWNRYGSTYGPDFFVQKLESPTGAERWRHAFDGAFHGADIAEALALDDAGDVLVAGTAQVAAEQWDVVLQKLDGTSGTERWRRTGTTDAWPSPPFVALAGAANGDALLLASPTTGPGDRDVVIVRAAGDDGGERWRRVVTGTAPGSDNGSAIVERPDGTVAVAARTVNAGSGPDFTVVTIAGADGGDPAPAP